jgi:hypothetical protein
MAAIRLRAAFRVTHGLVVLNSATIAGFESSKTWSIMMVALKW